MILGIPFAIWLGILTIILLFATFFLGIAMHVYKKPVFRYHKLFAFLAVILAVLHTIFAVLLWFFGIAV